MILKTKNIENYVKKCIKAGFLFSFLSTSYADVIVSIRPLGFIAAAITNGIVDLKILIPDGISPHHYSLKPSDLKKIKTADLFIWIGSNMETFLKKPLEKLPTQKQISLIDVLAIKKFLLKTNNYNMQINNRNTDDNYYNFYHNHYLYNKYNMHIWLSPDIARVIANIIYHRLIYLYPKYKKKLDENLHKFEEKLTQTDKNIAKMLKSVENKQYFVFHNAYDYFEKRYHLASLGYFTINPIIQPGAKKIYQIRTILTQKKIVCIFIEPQFRSALIKNTNVQIGILDPLGSGIKLSKDSYMEFLTVLSNQFKSCLDKN
ncbi:MAG: zinc ABC transporter substrate-binding protein ZnuA [Arsenophonus sp. ET-YP4-MAG3]